MDLTTNVMRSGSTIIERFAFAANKTFESALLATAKSAVRHAIAISPPASASGVAGGLDTGSEAKRRGYAAISRDLNAVFAPVRLKNKRREMISGTQMVAIHRRHLAAKRPGAEMRRDRAQPYYVDVRKFKQLETKTRASVGKLAAGWLPAARALGASAPAWIARHNGRGSVQIQTSGNALFVRAVNVTSARAPAWVGPEMQRRADYAVQYALNGLQRQMPYLLRNNATSAGLTVR